MRRFLALTLASVIGLTSCTRTLETISLGPLNDKADMTALLERETELDALVGKRVRLEFRRGRMQFFEGVLVEVTPQTLVLLAPSPKRTVRIARSSVRSISHIDPDNSTPYYVGLSAVAIAAVALIGVFNVFDPIKF